MSVFVSVVGSKPESDEYQGALRLKNILQNELPKNAIGEIVLHANATLMGQTVKDIDIFMLGTLQNCQYSLSITNNNDELSTNIVDISSFCTVIEIKSHGIEGIYREGTDFYVKYGRDRHSVTIQSNEQRTSAINFFKRMLRGYSPFVTNLIWFTGVTKTDIDNLQTIDSSSHKIISNALGADFKLNDLMQTIVWQKKPLLYRGQYHFDSSFEGRSITEFRNVLQSFARAKYTMGELSRKRIEQITTKIIKSNIGSMPEDKLTIYRGKAGTGKTIGLIHTAIELVENQEARVLILTYNRALVSDIRRLFALAELPDMFQESCVSIETMHSFFYKIINAALYNEKLTGENFLKNYYDLLLELLDFLSSSAESKEMILEMLSQYSYLKWDYCMVDEAQDWAPSEHDILLQLFSQNHIIVADGGQQFVRGINLCDWSSIQQRKSIKLKYCLRQRNNLVKFINHYMISLGKPNQKIISNYKLSGGKIILCLNTSDLYSILRTELATLKAEGNIPYDMMFFVPNDLVNRMTNSFIMKDNFESQGLSIWDGTNEEVRRTYSLYGDEVRVLQYESCRGLEAWTTVCMDFDIFIEDILYRYDDSKHVDTLLLESPTDRKLNYLVNWILMPLTRAIDTIIITFRNPKSETASLLKQIAQENPDYIKFL